MRAAKRGSRGQFSIIAALFVAVILVSSVMVTYSAIRYSSNQGEPQIISAIDETNLALKQVLGFTVGYYGSVLQVTGNSTYAKTLASNYLNSGLENIANVRPEWGASFRITDLQMNTLWFMNSSYSQGNLDVTYDLTGLGISGVAYSASSRLDVDIFQTAISNQVCLNVTRDGEQPYNDLSLQNFKFYRYRYNNLTWEMANPPSEPIAFPNGTYLVEVPPEINPYSYVIQVMDTRGITVAASSFSQYTGTLTFNSTVVAGGDYVDNAASNVDGSADVGTNSNFAAQQSAPDYVFDTLTSGFSANQIQDYYSDTCSPLGGTAVVGGSLSDLRTDNGVGMTLQAYPSAFSGSATFGYLNIGSSQQSIENAIVGSAFTVPNGGAAQSISAYLGLGVSSQSFGDTTQESRTASIEGTIRGTRYTPAYDGTASSITVYLDLSSASNRHVKAAIYSANKALIASTEETTVSSDGWVTLDFPDPKPELAWGTNYYLVAWSDDGSGSVSMRYRTGSYDGFSQNQAYGSWPASLGSATSNNHRYSIYCSYQPTAKVKAAIYSDSHNFVASTEEKTVSQTGWVTFAFSDPKPTLLAGTNYVLVVWSSSVGGVNLYYHSGSSNQGHLYWQTYGSVWPSSPSFSHSSREYSVYCTYQVGSEYTCAVEFSGTSNTNPWTSLRWTLDAVSSLPDLAVTYQLYDYQSEQYPESGNGYQTAVVGAGGATSEQNIPVNPTAFRDDIGRWKLKITAVNASSFALGFDLARYRAELAIYGLDLEEQWTDVNMTYLDPHPALCIKIGSLGSVNLAVDVWNINTHSWQVLINALVVGWNNFSVSPYLTSPEFTIRFRAASSFVQNAWEIDSVLLRPGSDQELFLSLQDPTDTVAVEVLQNGTLRWLGQNLQLAQEEVPIPPVPVKTIHVNETTVDGVNREIPFQVEDWASDYRVPLGLTNNATVFGNRQMIVFLINTKTAKFTIWWDGSDEAVQTPLAYTPNGLTFNEGTRTISNNRLSVQFASSGFTLTSTAAGASSTAKFMRINNDYDDTDPELAYVIPNGVIRDIVLGESEYSGGVSNCPNVYTNIVFTLPANASYYTYQSSLMFISSTQTRTISDLCPVQLSSTGQLQTENGTLLGDPVVANDTQTFSNSSGVWGHHWSQFINGEKGAGIMFTNSSNEMLYAFDAMPPPTLRGALKADATAHTIQLLPVALNSVSFQSALNLVWMGAVVTFDGTTPVYGGLGEAGLWVLAELPPTVAVQTGN